METRKITIAFTFAAVAALLLFASGCTQSSPQAPEQQAIMQPSNTNTPSRTGNLQPQAQSVGQCGGKTGDDLVSCTTTRAVGEKDVTVCTSLNGQEDRFSCIANWCGSQSRDYRQCDRLSNYDDNLGCLSKCNPNPNT